MARVSSRSESSRSRSKGRNSVAYSRPLVECRLSLAKADISEPPDRLRPFLTSRRKQFIAALERQSYIRLPSETVGDDAVLEPSSKTRPYTGALMHTATT